MKCFLFNLPEKIEEFIAKILLKMIIKNSNKVFKLCRIPHSYNHYEGDYPIRVNGKEYIFAYDIKRVKH